MTPRHAAKKPSDAPRSKKKVIVFTTLIVVLALIVGAVVSVELTRTSTSGAASSSGHGGPFAVVATAPTNNALVDSTAAIRISLSDDLAASSPMPTLTPAIPGSWERLSASTVEFVQQQPFQPGQTISVDIPGGPAGLTSASGAHLAASVTSSFSIGSLSLNRVQQLLAEEGYLPVTFVPSVATTQVGVSTGDELGSYAWRWSNLPSSLVSQWRPGVNNVVTQGAIMRFEDVHNLPTDGSISAKFESALLSDRVAGKVDPDPYTYVDVYKALPQRLNLYSNGQLVYTTLVNTGIPGQDTPDGTWPVYLRYRVTTMSGTNPDGTPYHDEGIPWTSYFHGGDALHGFLRGSYGSPQSLGCVEMPFANAGVVWPQTPLGTLVTVQT